MDHALLTPDFTSRPYWWDAAAPRAVPSTPLPKETEIAVVGGGFAGLSAALTLARAGKQVHLFEVERPGEGASTRNSGYIGSHLRANFGSLTALVGTARAAAMVRAGTEAHDFLLALLEREQITCGFQRTGRFIGAHTPKAYEALAREMEETRRHAGVETHMLSRAEQGREIVSPLYHGGAVMPRSASLHPGLYHAQLLDRVLAAGAVIHGETAVTGIARDAPERFTVATSRGAVTAGRVILCTNAYTPGRFPWFGRRIFPIVSNVIATEPLPAERLRQMLPTSRKVIETRRDPCSVRISPDGTRLLFGGLRGIPFTDHRRKALEMRAMLLGIFPQAADARISHCWRGQIGYTFDKLPHVGERDGVLFATGYCGTGVPLSTFLGHKMALRALGDADAATAFDDREPESRIYYRGTPWFVPLAARWYHVRDRADVRKAARAP